MISKVEKSAGVTLDR